MQLKRAQIPADPSDEKFQLSTDEAKQYFIGRRQSNSTLLGNFKLLPRDLSHANFPQPNPTSVLHQYMFNPLTKFPPLPHSRLLLHQTVQELNQQRVESR